MKVVFALLACMVSAVVARPNHIPGHVDPPKVSAPAPAPEALPKDVLIQQLPKTEILPTIPRVTRDLSHSYQTPEGIVRSESVDPVSNRIVGRVSWYAPNGVPYSVTYQGDDAGFHAQGAHIPR